ncbi:MAG: class I SAM-dependent methyltransferase [Gemmatimonadetes bacterium]|nr:class I SAM-dependent methyltransferase [Gemmatimonadota bacterium]
MTSIGLSQPRSSTSAILGALPADPALIDEERRFAATYEQLQPCFLDYSGFARAIAAIAGRVTGRARMVEFGCGTGILAAEVLGAVRHLDYRGLDPSPSMVEIFGRRAIAFSRTGRSISASSPVDLRLKASLAAAVRGDNADIVLMSQFLQTIPVRSSEVLTDRAGLVAAARHMLRPAGRVVIIEEVFGESLEEHRRFTNEWNRFAIGRICDRFHQIQDALRHVDPALLDLLVALPGRPSLIQVVREQLWRHGEPQLLPLSAWCRLFELMRLRYQAIPHGTLGNFYLFVIDY